MVDGLTRSINQDLGNALIWFCFMRYFCIGEFTEFLFLRKPLVYFMTYFYNSMCVQLFKQTVLSHIVIASHVCEQLKTTLYFYYLFYNAHNYIIYFTFITIFTTSYYIKSNPFTIN